jgi:hypothetical protein
MSEPLRLVSFLALLAVGIALLATPAGALSLTSNLGNFAGYGVAVESSPWHAVSFTTDANPYTLDSVSINFPWSPQSGAWGFEASIWSSSGIVPGALITTLSGNSTPGSGTHTYTATGTVNLAASTTYWVVTRSGSSSKAFYWGMSDNLSESGPGSIGNSTLSSWDAGASWPGGAPVYAALIGVEATLVPEPGTLGLLGAGLAGLAMAGRRRSLH